MCLYGVVYTLQFLLLQWGARCLKPTVSLRASFPPLKERKKKGLCGYHATSVMGAPI
jgi:hypothetical protein